jgi:hypothetical protein
MLRTYSISYTLDALIVLKAFSDFFFGLDSDENQVL